MPEINHQEAIKVKIISYSIPALEPELLLLLLICMSLTITGQPRNSVFICRV